MTVRTLRLPELPSACGGGRLGRHVRHDSRSRRYPHRPGFAVELTSVRHDPQAPVLDQGDVGCSTAAAMVGALARCPLFDDLPASVTPGLDLALDLYAHATALDGQDGQWPPEDIGSSGVAVCQAAKAEGLIAGYEWVFDWDAFVSALVTGPVLVGMTWWDSFDSPDADGVVGVGPSARPRGGHEVVADELDVERSLVGFANSWGFGWGLGGRFYMAWDTVRGVLAESGDAVVPIPAADPVPRPEPGVCRSALGSLINLGRDVVAGLRWSTGPRG